MQLSPFGIRHRPPSAHVGWHWASSYSSQLSADFGRKLIAESPESRKQQAIHAVPSRLLD
jgi:hypothetical protein